jgi:hypothetical protein
VTFTRQPRAAANDIIALAAKGRAAEMAASPVVQGRLDDMVAGIRTPGTNERLQFVREVVERKGLDPARAGGTEQVRRYLDDEVRRVLTGYEAQAHGPDLSVAFENRGLSSDTSIHTDFAIERALDAMKSGGLLGPGSIRRVAIVGPGLDFANKREGYDFYPQQTFQPFAAIDSLFRLGLGATNDLRLTTFDVSLRINHHLETARERAGQGSPYVLQLPLETHLHLNPDLVTYWKKFGGAIGAETTPVQLPSSIGTVSLRAVRVPPAVVLTIVPRDLNIVLQRLDPLPADEQFDLVLATNILIYYDVFEQALALANIAKMLRPGGVFLSNNDPVILPATPMDVTGSIDLLYSDQPNDRDRLVWSVRR